MDEDEDEDEGGRGAGDVDGEVEGRMEGRGGVDCKSGTNKCQECWTWSQLSQSLWNQCGT